MATRAQKDLEFFRTIGLSGSLSAPPTQQMLRLEREGFLRVYAASVGALHPFSYRLTPAGEVRRAAARAWRTTV